MRNGTGGGYLSPFADALRQDRLSEASKSFPLRPELRRSIRRLRNELGTEERAAAERTIFRRISSLGVYRRARTLAVFLAFDGEPNLAQLARTAARNGKSIYAPMILGHEMKFSRLAKRGRTMPNEFGIEQPVNGDCIDARNLDLILTPLVAFDEQGTRLGVGRGYYDRAFQFLLHRRHWSRPKLLGVGFSFQRVNHIDSRPWDVPLWGAVTEADTHFFGINP